MGTAGLLQVIGLLLWTSFVAWEPSHRRARRTFVQVVGSDCVVLMDRRAKVKVHDLMGKHIAAVSAALKWGF